MHTRGGGGEGGFMATTSNKLETRGNTAEGKRSQNKKKVRVNEIGERKVV